MSRRELTDEFIAAIHADRRRAADIAAEYGVSARTVESWRAAAHWRFGRPGQGAKPGTHRCVCPTCGTRHTAEESA